MSASTKFRRRSAYAKAVVRQVKLGTKEPEYLSFQDQESANGVWDASDGWDETLKEPEYLRFQDQCSPSHVWEAEW